MPNKASDLLNRIPSVTELLEKPPIRALANRWNRSVVAGGVRSFLEELRSDLQRRAAEVELPSVRELAELIMGIVGFDGVLVFDPSQPDGTPRKLLDIGRMTQLGWRPSTALAAGIALTYRDFLQRVATAP